MVYVIGLCLMLVALSPLLRRAYMQRFWVHGRGTIIRLDGAIATNPRSGGGWIWTPIIEYHAAGKRFTSKINYWQIYNTRSRYSVGDEVSILYDPRNPSRVMLDSWTTSIFLSVLLGGLIATAVLHGHQSAPH